MKKILKNLLGNFGLELRRISSKSQNNSKNRKFTMQGALQRCAERGLHVNTVIDVGASDGRWSDMCKQTLPNSGYLLVEAQKEHTEKLNDFCNNNTNASFVIAAAGPTDGKVYFDNTDLFGGLASIDPLKKNNIEVAAISIDNEVIRRGLKPPYLLKLDTHGFELPILEGAKNVLKESELVIIETYNYKLTNDSLKFYEICNYMEKIGFSPIEMVDFTLRAFDDSFWQMDTFFVKSTNESFNYNSYQ